MTAGERSEDLTPRPGGWVEGIGWVAKLRDLRHSDEFAYQGNGGTLVVSERTAVTSSPVIVTRWADGTIPAPAPPPERPQAEGVEWSVGDRVQDGEWDVVGTITETAGTGYIVQWDPSWCESDTLVAPDPSDAEPAAALPVRERVGDVTETPEWDALLKAEASGGSHEEYAIRLGDAVRRLRYRVSATELPAASADPGTWQA